MNLQCEDCGETIEIELEEFLTLPTYTIDCGGPDCKQNDEDRFMFAFTNSELKTLMEAKYKNGKGK